MYYRLRVLCLCLFSAKDDLVYDELDYVNRLIVDLYINNSRLMCIK